MGEWKPWHYKKFYGIFCQIYPEECAKKVCKDKKDHTGIGNHYVIDKNSREEESNNGVHSSTR